MRVSRCITSLLLFLSILPVFAGGTRETVVKTFFYSEDILPLKNSLLPLTEDPGGFPSFKELDFLRHYGAGPLQEQYRMGFFESDGKKLAAYLFFPSGDEVRGTVFLLHGYLDHTLSNTTMIQFLVDSGYAVAGFDLPGHGLSEGESADIGDFSEYSLALRNFLALCRGELAPLLPGPSSVVAHSTGCSIILEYLEEYEDSFDRIIFAAPLVYSVGWQFTALGLAIAEPFADSVFRRFGGSTSNRSHEEFVKNYDPLQSHSVPFSWIYAHHNWIERIVDIQEHPGTVLNILQGEEDSVVDYSDNMEFLTEKYPDSRVFYFPDGEHSLFNEPLEIRTQVFDRVLELLETAD